MHRRVFISGLAVGSIAVPRITPAQSARKVYRIGILGLRATSELVGSEPRSPTVRALLKGLGELGYVYGDHFVTEPRGADGRPERFPGLAAALVRLQVDVILAAGPALPALKQATSTISVIMTASPDAVRHGFVESLGRPGGNFTGFSVQSVETVGKRLELLKELVPGAATVAVLRDRFGILDWQAAEAAARERGWQLLSLEIRDAGEIESAFRAATGARAGAILVFAPGLLFPHARQVAAQATKSRLPAMYEQRPYVEAGGLVSYGADLNDIWRRAAVFVDKILKGAKPADLPVEQPTDYELVINLKTAKALGLTIPQSVLLGAKKVIR